MALDDEQKEELESICAELGLPVSGPTLGHTGYPIDVTKPNEHDSKSEFLLEKDAVKKLEEYAYNLVRGLITPKPEDNGDNANMHRRVNDALDAIARKNVHRAPFDGVFDLINDASRRQGLTLGVTGLLIELIFAIRKRLQELEEQERVFWTLKNRHPNHYARTIALRLAKRYAEAHGTKPTVGTSRDGGHPSTDFCRALERIFALLNIEAKVIHPAKWAVKQLTEADLNPPKNLFAQYGMAGNPVPNAFAMGNWQGQPRGIMDYIQQMTPKGSEE